MDNRKWKRHIEQLRKRDLRHNQTMEYEDIVNWKEDTLMQGGRVPDQNQSSVSTDEKAGMDESNDPNQEQHKDEPIIRKSGRTVNRPKRLIEEM